jgi:hypothetical protein
MGADQIADDQYFYMKEKELKELNDMRIRTLERMIREKVDIVQQQEAELSSYAQDLNTLRL